MSMSQPFSVMVSSKSDEYFTPEEYVEAVRRAMGEITLDPASCPEANQIVKAEYFYTKEQDGLSKKWFGNVFLNPPFSQTPKWVAKLEQEYSQYHIVQAVLLCKAALGYNWFEALWRKYPTILCRKRIQFIAPSSMPQPSGAAKQATAFIYLPIRGRSNFGSIVYFEQYMSRFGRLVHPGPNRLSIRTLRLPKKSAEE